MEAIGLILPVPRILGRAAADGFVHGYAFGIEISARSNTHATLDGRTEVGDNIAEQVVGHDHIEPLGVLHHPHACGVHMGIIPFDVGIFGLAYLVEGTLPEIEGVSQHICLAAEGERLFLVTLAGHLESEPEAAFHSLAGVDGFLHRDLVWRALLHEAAAAHIQALGILADHDKVDVLRRFVRKRRGNTFIQLDRTQIDILIEGKPEVQKNALLKNAGFHIRMSDRTQQDSVEFF